MFKRIRRLFENIGYLISWAPIIWDDCDYDFQDFMIKVIAHKLKRVQNHLKNCEYHDHDRGDINHIQEVLEHFKRFSAPYDYYDYSFPEMIIKEERPDGSVRVGHKTQADAKKSSYMVKFLNEMENWHWNEAWRKIAKHGRGWWC